VTATDTNSCSVTSQLVDITLGININKSQTAFSVLQDFGGEKLNVKFFSKAFHATLEIIDSDGKLISHTKLQCSPGSNSIIVNDCPEKKGIYIARLYEDDQLFTTRFAIK
jgi:hypothetical protein